MLGEPGIWCTARVRHSSVLVQTAPILAPCSHTPKAANCGKLVNSSRSEERYFRILRSVSTDYSWTRGRLTFPLVRGERQQFRPASGPPRGRRSLLRATTSHNGRRVDLQRRCTHSSDGASCLRRRPPPRRSRIQLSKCGEIDPRSHRTSAAAGLDVRRKDGARLRVWLRPGPTSV